MLNYAVSSSELEASINFKEYGRTKTMRYFKRVSEMSGVLFIVSVLFLILSLILFVFYGGTVFTVVCFVIFLSSLLQAEGLRRVANDGNEELNSLKNQLRKIQKSLE